MHSGTGRAGEGSIVLFYFVAGAIFFIDRITKLLALAHLSDSTPVIPGFFYLTLVHNHGIAFGLFAHAREVLLVIVSMSLAVLAWVAHRPAFRKPLDQWVLGLIWGGAFGNWLDRIQYGAVVDFLDCRVWPVFNVADSAISIGVGIYIVHLFRTSGNISKTR